MACQALLGTTHEQLLRSHPPSRSGSQAMHRCVHVFLYIVSPANALPRAKDLSHFISC